MNELFEGEFSGVGGNLFEDSDDLRFFKNLPPLLLNSCQIQLKIFEEKKETVHSHMHFLVLQTFKCHVSSCPKYMGAIVFKDMLKMVEPQETHFSTATDESGSETHGFEVLLMDFDKFEVLWVIFNFCFNAGHFSCNGLNDFFSLDCTP